MTDAPRDPAADLEAFRAYRASGDRHLRNEIMRDHHGLAVAQARRFVNRGEPLDDLIQVAQFGLLKAVERFDPDRGISFSSFAVPTIAGELKRHFRDHTWVAKVPRSAKELYLKIAPVSDELTNQLQRSPTIAEVADALDVSIDEVVEAMEAGSGYRTSSLSAAGRERDRGHDPSAIRELGQVEEGLGQVEAAMTVQTLLETLPERERMIVQLRFFDELTQSEIAERVGISQMHVSRLLRSTLATLAGRLGGPEDGENLSIGWESRSGGDGAGGTGRE